MTWLKNAINANDRTTSLVIYQSDGITPAPTTTVFGAIAAFKNLNGIATGSLANVVLTWHLTGAAGNSITIQTVADGSGTNGSVTGGPTAYVFHFQTGVTTINGMITTLTGLFALSGTFTGTNTLAAGDVFAAQTLGGGQDSAIFLRPVGGAWTTALGTLTNSGIVGHFDYVATQAESNTDADEVDVRIGAPNSSGQFTVGAVTFNYVIKNVEMRKGTLDTITEGSLVGYDLLRLCARLLMAKVGDFRTGTLVFRDLADSKNSVTVTTDASGRISLTINDPT